MPKLTKAERREARKRKRESADTEPVLSNRKLRAARAPLAAKTEAQGQYISNILTRDVTFGLGPAGTGKTFVAASLAAEGLERGDIETLVVTRPMVGCDEEMGFLPGDSDEKYAPWMEPVIDALQESLGEGLVRYLMKVGRIQGKPLQLMRGKTHKYTWVILDEAQNTTPAQMKMFLTRIGEHSKLIINGDLRQSDLKSSRGISVVNGLEDAITRLRSIPEIGVTEFTVDDIVRHGLVRKILEKYEGPQE